MQVTVSRNAASSERDRALRIAGALGMRWRERTDVDWSVPVLVCTRIGLRVYAEGAELRCHPGMLHAKLASGEAYPLARALPLSPGAVVLDTTLGLGTDAAYLACRLEVRVVGVEASPAIALITAEGLRTAAPTVSVVCAEAAEWMAAMPARSVHAVYADPLFPRAVLGPNATSGLDLVRLLGRRARVDHTWLDAALRVATDRVVVRAHVDDPLLDELGAPEIIEPRRRRPRLGIWRVDGLAPARPATPRTAP